MLIGMIESPSTPPGQVVLPTRLVERDSCRRLEPASMTTTVDSDKPRYLDPGSAIEERVDDLLGRMVLEEKVAQLGSRWVFELADSGRRLTTVAPDLLRHGLGQITRISGASSWRPHEAAELANLLQRHLVKETRLGIPAVVHEEICSGLMARDATIFPQAIGLASTWEPTLIEELAAAVREQMRATGAHQGLGPVLDVCRDPRWGRLEETFGEDPYLVSRMGVAFVRGLQGDDLRAGVVATAKHLVGYGASEGGRNWAPAQIPARELRDVYLQPFEAAVRLARVRSVMNAYNELDGVPCAANRDLLTTLLRDEWGFDGCVVSDYFSVRQLADYHRFAADAEDAAATTLGAGIDVELPSTDCYGQPLLDAVRRELISGETLDEAVRRVLRTKFELGLFEQPYVDVSLAEGANDTRAQRDLAREHRPQEPGPASQRWGAPAPFRPAVRGRNRARRRPGAVSLRRLRLPGARRVASGRPRERPGPVLPAAATRSARDRQDHPGRAERPRRAARGVRRARPLRPRLRRERQLARGLRRGDRARTGRRCRDRDAGRQVGPHGRVHERREPRSCLPRSAGPAGGAPAIRLSRPARQSCSSSSPAGRTGAPARTSSARRCCSRGCRVRKAPRRSSTHSSEPSAPAASSRSPTRARPGTSRSSTDTRRRAAARIRRATMRTGLSRPCTRSDTG